MKVKKIDKRYSGETKIVEVRQLIEDHIDRAVSYDSGYVEANEEKITALTDVVENLIELMVCKELITPKDLTVILSAYGVTYADSPD